MGGTPILQPNVSLTLRNAQRDVSNEDQRVLFVGQMLAAGTAVDGALVENISSSGAPENGLAGQSSMAAAIVRAFKSLNEIVQLDGIFLDDASGTPRVVEVTYVGTATAAGTLNLVVASEVLHNFDIAVVVGDDPTAIAAKAVALVNADLNCPFTATNTLGVLELTADNDGLVANSLGVETSGTVAGVTGQAVAEATAGATDPTLTGILDVATARYQAIIWPYADTSVLRAYLDARFNGSNELLDGMGFNTTVDTHSNHLTALNLLNSESLTMFNDKLESETNYKGPAQNEPTYSKSAQFAAVRALRLTKGASVARFVTSSASLDQFGGPAHASLPYFNTFMPDLPVIGAGRGWTQVEIQQLIDAGGSVMGVNATGTAALVGEVVTTYKTDAAANPDDTFKFLNYVDTGSNVREYFFNNLKARFAQSRLTEGAVTRGRDMVNEIVFRAYCEQLYQDLSGADFVLVQRGEIAIQFFKANLSVAIALSTGTISAAMFAPIITQAREINMPIHIVFSTEG